MDKKEVGLKKELGLLTPTMLVIGTIIGAGVFFKPTAVYSNTGSAGLGLLAWFLGGLLTICSGLTVAELSASINETGGMTIYIKKAYGNLFGFLTGWSQIIVFFPATIAALSIIFSTQVLNLFGLESTSTHMTISILVAVLVMGLNFISAKFGGIVQVVSTICKLIPLVLIVIFGLISKTDVTFSLFPMTTEGHPFLTSLGAGLIATLFAYDGWIQVGTIAGEMKRPDKDLPKAIIIGISTVMIVYIIVNIAYLSALTAGELSNTSTPAADVAQIIFGPIGGKIVTIGILISVFGTINGYSMTSMRVPYAMALENKLPFSKWFSKLGEKSRVPYNSGIFTVVLAIIMIFSGKFDQLTDMSVFSIWIFYIMTFFAVFKLRKSQPNLHRPYRVPLFPFIPILAIIGGLYVVINTIFTDTFNALTGIGLTLIGLPVYYFLENKNK